MTIGSQGKDAIVHQARLDGSRDCDRPEWVSRVVLGHIRSWPQTSVLCSMSVWKAHPGLLAGSTTLGRQQDGSELTPSPSQPHVCPFGLTGDICESSERRTQDRNSLCSAR